MDFDIRVSFPSHAFVNGLKVFLGTKDITRLGGNSCKVRKCFLFPELQRRGRYFETFIETSWSNLSNITVGAFCFLSVILEAGHVVFN